jgi:putative drug exporter of the RND superfamily
VTDARQRPNLDWMLVRLARFCVRRKWIVVFAIWLPILVAANIASGAAGSAFSTSFTPPDSESADVIDQLEPLNPEAAGFTGQIVFRAEQGIDDPEIRAAMEGIFEQVAELDGVRVTSPYPNDGDDPALQAARAGQISADGTIAYAALNITDRPQTDFLDFAEQVEAFDDPITEGPGAIDGLTIEYGGDVFGEFELPASELYGLIAAMIILILAFGSVLAMGLPIGTAIVGLATGAALVTVASHAVSMPDFTVQMTAMIGLGVGIDYALFIVQRFREGMQHGLGVDDAIVDAIDTSGRAVIFAGMSVLISLCGMFLMGLAFMNGLAIGAITGVLMMMAASITLLPAFLAIVRERVNTTTRAALIAVSLFILGAIVGVLTTNAVVFLVGLVLAIIVYAASFAIRSLRTPLPHRVPKPNEQTFWYKWSRFIQHRPWPVLIGAAGFLVLLTIPLFSIRMGFGDTGNLNEEQTARRAYDLLAEGFGPGIAGNGQIIITVAGADAANTDAIAQLESTIAGLEGVAQSPPPAVQPFSDDLTAIFVVPATAPQDAGAEQLVNTLRDDVIPASGLDAKVGGWTASGIDFSDYLAGRLPLLIGAVLILSFLLLMAVFRSVLVPLKAVILNLLSIGAAYGGLVAIFQWGWGKQLIGVDRNGPIEPWLPMMMFAIVFGLSMDYEVFLLSRMREHYLRTRNNAVAVADGLAVTARVITAAALIMVCVFLSFVIGDDRSLKMFGLGLAIAVAVDATVVRMLLVPATMELLGDRNWWIPKWLDRILPSIDVEGHHVEGYVEDQDVEERVPVSAGD